GDDVVEVGVGRLQGDREVGEDLSRLLGDVPGAHQSAGVVEWDGSGGEDQSFVWLHDRQMRVTGRREQRWNDLPLDHRDTPSVDSYPHLDLDPRRKVSPMEETLRLRVPGGPGARRRPGSEMSGLVPAVNLLAV